MSRITPEQIKNAALIVKTMKITRQDAKERGSNPEIKVPCLETRCEPNADELKEADKWAKAFDLSIQGQFDPYDFCYFFWQYGLDRT